MTSFAPLTAGPPVHKTVRLAMDLDGRIVRQAKLASGSPMVEFEHHGVRHTGCQLNL